MLTTITNVFFFSFPPQFSSLICKPSTSVLVHFHFLGCPVPADLDDLRAPVDGLPVQHPCPGLARRCGFFLTLKKLDHAFDVGLRPFERMWRRFDGHFHSRKVAALTQHSLALP